MNAENQYLTLCQRVLEEGVWSKNERTGVYTKTVINADLVYGGEDFPILTTKKCYVKSAIAEILGYIKGFDSAQQFRELGTNTWNANANENEAWLNNPNRKGEDDLGRVYGVQGREWEKPDGGHIDQLQKIVFNLMNGIDDRGEILTFWNPGEFDKGCLRPCMHSYQFSILGDTLHLNITQRSADLPLGAPFNMIQGYVMLLIMSKLTKLNMGKVYHKIVNAHIYENQVDGMIEQLSRSPITDTTPILHLQKELNSLVDVENLSPNDFVVKGYTHHEPIKFPFSV